MVKQGYKPTEIGVIPEDWEVVDVLSVSNLITKGTTPRTFTNSGINYIKIESFLNNKIVEDYCVYIDEVTHNFDLKRSILKEGDILFAIAGATIGKCAIVHADILPANTNQALAIVRVDKGKVCTQYLFEVYKSQLMLEYIKENAIGGAQPNLNLEQVGKFQIPLPPLAEQEAIASALSDADAWIDSLEQLIAKKRLIKQGAMQTLLTPPSHAEALEAWEVKKLGEMSVIYTGKKNNQDKIENGKYPFFVRSQTVERINSYSYDGEAILIPGEGNLGSIVHYINGKFDFHQRVYKISDFNGLHGKYLYFYFRMYFGAHAMQNTVKATVDSIRLPTLEEFVIKFPSLSEQERIATVLSDMDAELEALETQLGKARQIKQGMMQELLTGRTRLV